MQVGIHKLSQSAYCRQTRSYPETGFGEINGDVRRLFENYCTLHDFSFRGFGPFAGAREVSPSMIPKAQSEVGRTRERALTTTSRTYSRYCQRCDVNNSYQFVRFPTAQSGGCYIVAIALLSMRLPLRTIGQTSPKKRGCGVSRTPIGTYDADSLLFGLPSTSYSFLLRCSLHF